MDLFIGGRSTVEALKNPSHSYRAVIDAQFGGTAHVGIWDIGAYKNIRPTDFHIRTNIIVGTVQSLRVQEKQRRKLYQHNEHLEPHFAHIPRTQDMDKMDNGSVRYSFFNLMKHHRPVLILDEGHRFKSTLSEDLIRDLNPTLVLEFTATPKGKKNVLVSVPATTLRDEEMIKMPVRLATAPDWQMAVHGALFRRKELSKIAYESGENIRPIVLFQAENKDKAVPVHILKKYLVDTEKIPEQKIAIATGDQRELDGIDIMSPDCPIEYVITVQALKEGWDCPYAYIFCSVANIQSSTDIEQLLGRVLRMPFAKRRKADALNCAYAYAPETTQFAQSAQQLVDKLVDMGFEDSEAEDMVEWQRFDLGDDTPLDITVNIPVTNDFELGMLGASANDFVEIVVQSDTTKHIRIIGAIPTDQQQIIANKIIGDKKTKQGYTNAMRLVAKHHAKQESFAMRNIPFGDIPQLMLDYGDGVLPVTPELFLEAEQWDPFEHDHLIQFNIETTTGNVYTIDISETHKIEVQQAEPYTHTLFSIAEGWTQPALVVWLEKYLHPYAHGMLAQSTIVEYIGRNLDTLNTDIQVLGRCRNQVLEALKRNLLATQQTARESAMQKYLFDDTAHVEIGNPFIFEKYTYNPPQQYHGAYQFKNHYYGVIAHMNGEELEVAKTLDTLPEVQFWVRNLDKGTCFKLPLHKNNFHPDFVARLTDGRVLVVEHKGQQYMTNDDSKEKNRIGTFWAEKTGNVFVMTTKTEQSPPIHSQIAESI